MPRLNEAVRDERRRGLIDAAWRCASHKGFRDLTVDEVCAEAGVSKGAFYGYFESKQELLLALLEADAAELDELVFELGRAAIGGVERLRRYIRALAGHGGPGHVQVRAELWATILTDDAVRDGLAASVARRRQTLRGWVREGIDAGELVDLPANALAAIIVALTDGLTLHGSLDPSGFRWENVRAALGALLDGVTTRPPAAGGPDA
jgi:AcrR family transcriptional regulator